MSLSIRWKLILSISIPLLVTYLGMLGWDYWRQRESAMHTAQEVVSDRAVKAATLLDTRLAAIMQVAESTAAVLDNRPNMTDADVAAQLQRTLGQNVWVTSIILALEPNAPPLSAKRMQVVRRNGRNNLAPVVDLRSRQWYIRARDSRAPGWSEPYDEPRESLGRRICTYSIPLIVNNQFHGVVAVSIFVEELEMLHNRPERNPPRDAALALTPATTAPETDSAMDIEPHQMVVGTESFAVLDAQGRIISSPDPHFDRAISIFDLARDLNNDDLASAATGAVEGKTGIVRIDGLQRLLPSVNPNTHHWIAFAPIQATGWIFAAATSESTIMQPILQRLFQRAAFLGAGLAILLIVVMLVSIRISRPIERLAGAVDRLAAGDLDAHVTGVKSRDELGRLADGFNHMTRQLKSHVAALTEQTAAREKVESEVRIARKIQTDLLPRTFPPFPERTEFDLHASNVPAAGVAGDFFDFFFATPDKLTIIVADVSGKGVPAALLMAVTRTIVRNLSEAGLNPVEIARRANAMLIADSSAWMFVTMFLCQYEPATGKITYVNAGHPQPIRLSPGAPPQRFGEVTAPLIGVSNDELGPFEQREDMLAPGEAILIYTDGLTEARNAAGLALGENGLIDLVRPLTAKPPEAICQNLSSAVEAYENGRRGDDLTLLVLRRK